MTSSRHLIGNQEFSYPTDATGCPVVPPYHESSVRRFKTDCGWFRHKYISTDNFTQDAWSIVSQQWICKECGKVKFRSVG